MLLISLGILFPATYDLAGNSKATDVVATMLETFDGKITDKWKSYCDENGMSLYELVTLASIVEKKAAATALPKILLPFLLTD